LIAKGKRGREGLANAVIDFSVECIDFIRV